jgi:hypothetical protein
MTPSQLTSLDGFVPFQGTDSLWNIDISNLPVDPDSDKIIAFIGASTPLHPDFGSGELERAIPDTTSSRLRWELFAARASW